MSDKTVNSSLGYSNLSDSANKKLSLLIKNGTVTWEKLAETLQNTINSKIAKSNYKVVKFNGFVDNVTVETIGISEVSISDIKFDKTKGYFVALKEGKYYNSWATPNCSDYNEDIGQKAACNAFVNIYNSDPTQLVMFGGYVNNVTIETYTSPVPLPVEPKDIFWDTTHKKFVVKVVGGTAPLTTTHYYDDWATKSLYQNNDGTLTNNVYVDISIEDAKQSIVDIKSTLGNFSDLEYSATDITDALNKAYNHGGGGGTTDAYTKSESDARYAKKTDLEEVLFFDEEIDAPEDKDIIDKVNDLASKILEKPTASGTQGQVLSLDAQGKTIWKDESGGGSGSTPMVSLTYAQLKAKRDGGTLVAGTQYRITDYATTTITSNTQSAGHAFDVIVVADSASTLNEDARAILHSGDSYFANCDLNAWELKYCLDNDTTRFEWADATNGKGVIYRMKDEWGNDVPYDFKNIQYLKSGSYVYTFLSYQMGNKYDATLSGASCFNNYIGEYRNGKRIVLNANTFREGCNHNILGANCYNNTINAYCSSNTFGANCYNNTIRGNYNLFGNYCHDNVFTSGENNYNNLGEYCCYNTFDSYCSNNTFGSNCSNNIFDSYCSNNTFGDACSYNKFGTSSATKSYCRYITLEIGVQYTYLYSTEATSSSARLQNIHICSGVAGTSSAYKTITIPTTNNSFLTTVYLNESGTLCYEKSGEVASKVEDIGLNKADKIAITNETETTVASLSPNVLHKWGEVASLTITALATPTDTTKVNEYLLEFVSGETATSLSLPESISWMGGSTPTINANKSYQISIVNNLAVIGEF